MRHAFVIGREAHKKRRRRPGDVRPPVATVPRDICTTQSPVACAHRPIALSLSLPVVSMKCDQSRGNGGVAVDEDSGVVFELLPSNAAKTVVLLARKSRRATSTRRATLRTIALSLLVPTN